MTTLKDLSRHLGLSTTQVSRALNDYGDVSPATKERVRKAAKALNYIPNMTARRLATGRSNIVGLVWHGRPDHAESWVFAQFVGGLSAEFEALGLQFVLNIAENDGFGPAAYERLIASRSIDGFVLVLPRMRDQRVRVLQEHRVPFVMHGQTTDDPNYAFYDIDNVAVGHDLTSHLLDHGHREIAFINGPLEASFVQRRRDGYAAALREAGVSPRARFHVGGAMTEQLGLLETVRLFQSAAVKPTAIPALVVVSQYRRERRENSSAVNAESCLYIPSRFATAWAASGDEHLAR